MEERVRLVEFLSLMRIDRRESVKELMGESEHQRNSKPLERNPAEFYQILRELADKQSAIAAIEAVIAEIDAP